MALTPQDFKDRFPRGFNYLPVWSALNTYNTGDLVYYDPNGFFYKATADGITSDPSLTPAEWDLDNTQDVLNYVSDADIENAFACALLSFNGDCLFSEEDAQNEALLLLTAHKLALSLRETGGNSTGAFTGSSKTVGSVSESYSVPDWVNKSPIYSVYATTQYGLDYIVFVHPYTIGTAFVVGGATLA